MAGIVTIKGDATCPQAAGNKIICHICNDIGKWGTGFVLALSARWPEPERAYREWYNGRAGNDFALGAVQLVRVEPYVWVANMVGQHGIRGGSGGPPIRYTAVDECLRKAGTHAAELKATVHMPRIGCGLAGGKWEKIEPLIVRNLCERGVDVTVYDFGK